MENQFVSSPERGTFERVQQRIARKAFEQGATIYLMTSDRDPVHSLTTETPYRIGCKRWFGTSIPGCIESFDDVLDDFEEWLDCDGYGHMPDHYRAKYRRFSYWIKLA